VSERTQVAIIGGGPSGLLLSQLLELHNIDCVVIERRSRDYVLGRIRAGVLEQGLIDLLAEARVADRLHAEGEVHTGVDIVFRERHLHIDLEALTGGSVVTVYGQTELTRDLYNARDDMDGKIVHGAENVRITEIDTDAPVVEYEAGGKTVRLACDFVAGCDGFHGVSRAAIPESARRYYERVYPFGWLGILSETPPVSKELVYVAHERGFALCSKRSASLSRYYVQCALDEHAENWSDDRFWTEFRRRLPDALTADLCEGPSIEKSIAPLRSFVCEPMSWQRLFLVGDAGHIVPPTGAKGLNLAASDVYYLWTALMQYYRDGDEGSLAGYSDLALARVWKAERFSWWMTQLLHRFPASDNFDERLQQAEFDYLADSSAAQQALAENYVGLPY
jgi:p-hydroxybenzoate 3-monooxygenase